MNFGMCYGYPMRHNKRKSPPERFGSSFTFAIRGTLSTTLIYIWLTVLGLVLRVGPVGNKSTEQLHSKCPVNISMG